MDVAAQRPSVSCGLDEDRVEAALEQRTRTTVLFIELRRVAAFERVHAGGEIQVGEFEEDVEVVGHEDVCEDSPAAAGGDAVEESEPLVAIIVVADDVAVIDNVAITLPRDEPKGSDGWNRRKTPYSVKRSARHAER